MTRLLIVLAVLVLSAQFARAAKVISVTDFGARPNDGADDSAAVRQAIRECVKTPGAVLKFPKGRYDFFPVATGRPQSPPGMFFADCQGITVDGGGSTLVYRGVMGAMSFRSCRDVVVKDLTIDWDRPPYSVGTVVADGEKYFDVDVQKAFPVQGGEPVGAFMEYDPKTKFPRRDGLDVYYGVDRTELVGPQRLRVHLKRDATAAVGALMILRHQVYGPGGIGLNECDGARVENVTIYTAPGMGVTGTRTSDIVLRNVRIVPKPDSPNMMSVTADATHFNSCTGEITIEGCEFEGMGDDATNVHGMFHNVTERVDERTVRSVVRNQWLFPPKAGQEMEFTDPATLLPYATGTVAEVAVDNQAKNHRITFAKPLPDRLKVGDWLGNVAWAPKLRIRNCKVRGNRARGFLIQTRDAVIEGCHIAHNQSAAINVTTDLHPWTESIGTRKIVIRNNVFEDVNNCARWHPGAISIFADLAEGKGRGAVGVHRDIVIEGNTIRDTADAAIYVCSADGVVIRNNTIEASSARPRRPEGRHAIYVQNSRNVEITANKLTPGPGQATPVGMSNSPTETVKVHDNEGF
ncbi:MAG TPA: right-handed parallel beta-helix repeat-containing protein [Phycisphaerae bacterium]|nr:right-handed parallel beta-helix repeat-containing protein [Phycisphaerae bacterium]